MLVLALCLVSCVLRFVVLSLVDRAGVKAAPRARFTYCPDNVTMVTNMERVAVWWREPLVDAIVSSPPVLVSQNTLPGGLFTTGVTAVLYRTLNADGVPTYCQFYIVVITLGLYVVHSPLDSHVTPTR